MAMNRAQKRMLQRQGALGADGEATRERPQQARKGPPTPQQREQAKEKRTSPPQFLREVRAELRKVAWPTRSEVVNYSIIVLFAIIAMTAFIALVDYGSSEFVLKLFDD
jgi:preprotein translocase subunit SecE